MSFNKKYTIRVIAAIALCVCILFLPWWFVVIALIAAALYFETYFEIILFGVVIDSLYGVGVYSLFHIPITYTVFGIVVFLLSLPLRKRIRATI
jgi:hypothetical protein